MDLVFQRLNGQRSQSVIFQKKRKKNYKRQQQKQRTTKTTMMMMMRSSIVCFFLFVMSTVCYAGTTSEGLAFLAKKKGETGVVETDSGLMYKEIRPGTGKSPSFNDPCVCHYVRMSYIYIYICVCV